MPATEDNSEFLIDAGERLESAVESTSADGHSVKQNLAILQKREREARNRNAEAIAAGKNRPVSSTINLRNAMGY